MHAERPLSSNEHGYWLFQQMHPRCSAHNFTVAARVRGPLDLRALELALLALYERHAALRTRYPLRDGKPIAEVLTHPVLDFAVQEAEMLDEADTLALVRRDAFTPFALGDAPAVRARLYRRGPADHILLWAGHHIVLDLWSTVVLIKELIAIYPGIARGQQLVLDGDVVDWQTDREQHLHEHEADRLSRYWRDRLADLAPLELPSDRPRPLQRHFGAGTHRFESSSALCADLHKTARGHHTTLFSVLLGAYQTLLHRITGQNDIVIGVPTAGRHHRRMRDAVGCFINVLPIRQSLHGETAFSTLLQTVTSTVREAVSRQAPLPYLMSQLGGTFDATRPPIFQTLFSFERAQGRGLDAVAALVMRSKGASLEIGPLHIESLNLDSADTDYELTLSIGEVDGRLLGSIVYNRELFDEAHIASIAEQYLTLLSGIAANPDQSLGHLPRVNRAQTEHLVHALNQTEVPESAACAHALIEAQVKKTPDAIAVRQGKESLTFRALDARAAALASALAAKGAGPERKVAIMVQRSCDLVVALYAVLKTGAAFVPLDPSHPKPRIAFILSDSESTIVVSRDDYRKLLSEVAPSLAFVAVAAAEPAGALSCAHSPAQLAYLIYTSGSTGQPKGVLLTQANLVNFFAAMNRRIPGGAGDTWLAVTTPTFDISLLELLWTLTRGFTVVLSKATGQSARQPLAFSLSYFANDEDEDTDQNKYRLLLEGARFADQHGLSAVWVPERHFHSFGGLYANPSVLAAAIAAITKQIQIRAGSVVLPLHDPLRVAEEWSIVDNLSQGRAGVSFASGWQADDFVLAPDKYATRRKDLLADIGSVRALWRGEALQRKNGLGETISVRTRPRPVQAELPIWLTAAGSAATFELAGMVGAGVLTHLLGQSETDLKDKLAIYREAFVKHGHGGTPHVTLMLHAFVGEDRERVRAQVHAPMLKYLASSLDLATGQRLGKAEPRVGDFQGSQAALLEQSFNRYFESSGLFGNVADCTAIAERFYGLGVDEIACLIDFGVATEQVLDALPALAKVAHKAQVVADPSLAEQIIANAITHLQCTPSTLRLILSDSKGAEALAQLRVLLVGGEALPFWLAERLHDIGVAAIFNMYGPTETTVWSTTHALSRDDHFVSVGRPIDNTRLYVVDSAGGLVPQGRAGELWIGGSGVARGYHKRPDLDAARFAADPFVAGGRIYKTGDLARYHSDDTLEILGRIDDQVKIRGHRVEPGEVAAVLARHPEVGAAAVLAVPDAAATHKLVAYVVPAHSEVSVATLRPHLLAHLPEALVPAQFIFVDSLPLTPAGKIDRAALLARRAPVAQLAGSELEDTLARMVGERLGITVHKDDDFFAIGGHSLLAAELLTWLRDTFEVELPLHSLIEMPTMAAIAGAVSRVLAERREQRAAT